MRAGAALDGGTAAAFCRLPVITPCAVHYDDATHCIMSSELAFLFGAPGSARQDLFGAIAVMQRLLQVHALPGNLTRMQLRALHARMRVCERSARDAMVMHVCVSCCFGGGAVAKQLPLRGQCRLDWAQGGQELLCSECQGRSVLRINTLGRVVTLRHQRFYLAPCCFSVQPYTATGMEFQTEFCDPGFYGAENLERLAWRPDVRPDMCTHRRAPKPTPRQPKPRCEMCVGRTGGSQAPERFTAVDHLTGEVHSIYLCPRHAPHSSVMRHVVNWEELMAEVRQRDRPLFASRK
jgi:hypothetical protein